MYMSKSRRMRWRALQPSAGPYPESDEPGSHPYTIFNSAKIDYTDGTTKFQSTNVYSSVSDIL
jgi:hypothetical protein